MYVFDKPNLACERKEMKPDFSQLYAREKKVFHIINKVEARGLAFDTVKAKRKRKLINCKITRLKSQMKVMLDHEVNFNSPPQVLKALLSIGVPEKLLLKKGKLTTGEKVVQAALRRIKRKQPAKFVKLLMNYRSHCKVSNTYLEPRIKRAEQNNGTLYCSVNPTDTRTGRMASPDHNIPEPTVRRTGRTNPVRECFICRDGFHNYYFDYVQMEMAKFGLLANEERILKGYKRGEDIHRTMAEYIFGKGCSDFQRNVTKNISFGIIYGMGIKAMAVLYEMDYEEAKEFYNIYMEEFPSIRAFQEECKQRLQLDGYVRDYFGKIYHLSPHEAYKAVNALVQGSCAQTFKVALINIDKFLTNYPVETYILLPIHDEFMIESRIWRQKTREKQFIKKISNLMVDIEQLDDYDFKLRVDVAKSKTSWAEKERIKP